MKNHPFTIHDDGSVSYNDDTYKAVAVKELVEAVKNEIDETESHLGSFAGHQLKLKGARYTHLQIGCQAFHVDCIKAFIDDYEQRTQELLVKMGDMLISGSRKYLVAKARPADRDGIYLSLVNVTTGNIWADPVHAISPNQLIPISQLTGPNAAHKFEKIPTKE